jgi:DNA ligase-1
MLADTAPDVETALAWLQGEAGFEYKLDGARVQVHKDGDQIEVYSRALNRVTPAVPEVVERVAALSARRLILDGEAIALAPSAGPCPSRSPCAASAASWTSRPAPDVAPGGVFFDALRIDDDTLIDRPLAERWQAMTAATAGASLVPALVTARADEAEAFAARAWPRGTRG